MLKQLPFVGFLLLISACEPIIEKDSPRIKNVLIPQCIASQSQCEVSIDLTKFSIKFSQEQLADKIKSELPFTIELTKLAQSTTERNSSSLNVQQPITQVSAYLEGKDMFMGKVPVFFEPTDQNNVYSAESLLASCHEEFMVWRLWVTLETGDKKQTFFVDFTSQR